MKNFAMFCSIQNLGRITRSRFALVLLFLLVCAGCLHKPEPQTYDPLYDEFNEIALTGKRAGGATLALDGFSMRWADAPFRVHRLGAGLIGALAVDNKISGRALLTLEADPSSRRERFDYNLDYAIVHTGDSMFYHGEVIDLPIIVGDGRRDVAVDLNRNGFGGIPRENISVFLRGFYLNTEKGSKDGYPVLRFSAGIEHVRFDARGRLRFDAVMTLDANTRGEERVDAKLFYTVAGIRGGAVTEKSFHVEQPSKNISSNTVEIKGKPGAYPFAFVGIKSFSLEHGRGAYLVRGLHFRNTDFRYDARDGSMRFVNRAGLESGGAFRRNGRVHMRARFTLVQLPAGDNSIRHTGFHGTSDKLLVQKRIFSMRAAKTMLHFPMNPAKKMK